MVKKDDKKMKNPVEPIPDPVTIKSVKHTTLAELLSKEGADAVSVSTDNMWKTHVKGLKIHDDVKLSSGSIYWVIKKGKKEQKVL